MIEALYHKLKDHKPQLVGAVGPLIVRLVPRGDGEEDVEIKPTF